MASCTEPSVYEYIQYLHWTFGVEDIMEIDKTAYVM